MFIESKPPTLIKRMAGKATRVYFVIIRKLPAKYKIDSVDKKPKIMAKMYANFLFGLLKLAKNPIKKHKVVLNIKPSRMIPAGDLHIFLYCSKS